ncbi:hypothetical protein M0P48_00975 [Candidatus Gracilibacteria bacterium]|nr:hypothetical protein [Candidatus Gracilibacteria bacterium]
MMQDFYKIQFKEKRLIYDDKLEEGWAVPIARGAGDIMTSAAELIGLATSTTKDAVGFLKAGKEGLSKFMKNILTKAKDKMVGKPLELAEFREFKNTRLFLPQKTNCDNPKGVNEINDHASKIAALIIRKNRLENFYRPAVDNFSQIEIKLNEINAKKFKTEEEIFKVNGEITGLDNYLKEAAFEKDDPRRIETESRLVGLRSRLHILQESISKVIKWEIPNLTKDIVAGYKQRLQFTPPQDETLVNLEALYRHIEIYTIEYSNTLERYNEEIEKHEYYMAKTYEGLSEEDRILVSYGTTEINVRMSNILKRENKNNYDVPVSKLEPLTHLQSKPRNPSPNGNTNNLGDILNVTL